MGISLLTMGQGNVKVLMETFRSFSTFCDEIVYGDLLIWDEDREVLKEYEKEFNLRIVKYPFNFIYKKGFSYFLNDLSKRATNNMVIYANTSEVIDKDYGAGEIINSNPDCNCFYMTHRTEHYRWFRCYDRRFLEWSGFIHESLVGDHRPFHKPILMFKDLEKDMDNQWKATIFNLTKEYVYFNNLNKIVDNPELLGGTDPGWMTFAKEQYASNKERMEKRPSLHAAFEIGNLYLFWKAISNDPELINELFKSSDKIAYQGDKIHLL